VPRWTTHPPNTAGVRPPLTRREARLRVTVNRAVTLDETLEVPEPIVAAPVAVARAAPPPSVQVEVIREA